MSDTTRGRVIISHGAECLVEDTQGTLMPCKTRRSTGRTLCGDWVQWAPSGAGEGVIERIEPRRTLLARPNFRNKLRPIAANIDQMVVVSAPRPGIDLELIDRYLVLAENLDIQPLLWLNKMDLLAAEERESLETSLQRYRELGYGVLLGSVKSAQGLAELEARLREGTSILVGQSGVGKSSLIQALLPDLELRIGALSHASGLGKHTTTETTLYHLRGGGDLIDSPGIRTLRLGHLSADELERGFREFRPYLGQCRFNDCRHRSEPGCAILGAVQQGEIAAERLERYYRLLDAED
ncbi:small ribosomal subunit biogenesis GTPase RsgA [Alkalilimnicola sp. S0819]|uniref:small ribosomal subunit biogenesis GTPase RsgA n=1 Tax=Alkalilimnicola sp. S0819 TaxID=2613922 RepID=UPI00126156FD|nr:small ribosomal subunit biogenesis GTPase RsgA [Alkalilimnicola sp. S0819]KAB7619748.1 small ribosomal subunit biogenesis GTPase RsgA [Alkalilimnicola sp. S0819]MPQ17512.1 small ribosomal subunit biogenesis GTPase RsgA [Alkalilimnicola sp. S0819]